MEKKKKHELELKDSYNPEKGADFIKKREEKEDQIFVDTDSSAFVDESFDDIGNVGDLLR